jgi:hypothetical protein
MGNETKVDERATPADRRAFYKALIERLAVLVDEARAELVDETDLTPALIHDRIRWSAISLRTIAMASDAVVMETRRGVVQNSTAKLEAFTADARGRLVRREAFEKNAEQERRIIEAGKVTR